MWAPLLLRLSIYLHLTILSIRTSHTHKQNEIYYRSEWKDEGLSWNIRKSCLACQSYVYLLPWIRTLETASSWKIKVKLLLDLDLPPGFWPCMMIKCRSLILFSRTEYISNTSMCFWSLTKLQWNMNGQYSNWQYKQSDRII